MEFVALGNEMLDLDNIVRLLKDRRLSMVSDATGLSVSAIAAIRDGRQTNPTYGTMKLLSGYLMRAEEATNNQSAS